MDIFLSIPAQEQVNLWGFVYYHSILELVPPNTAMNYNQWY